MDEREQNMIRLGCLRDAVATVDIEQREGYFKQKGATEDIIARINLYFNKYLEWISTGKKPFEEFQIPQKPQETPAIQPQIIPPVEKKYSDVHCMECDRKLTIKELEFINKTGRDKICYQCDKKRKEIEES